MWVAEQEREWRRTLEAASQALQLDPSSSHALFRGAQAAYGLGDLSQAVSFCDRLVGSTDEDVMALQKRVWAEFAGDDFQD